jgi:hypothetical protein
MAATVGPAAGGAAGLAGIGFSADRRLDTTITPPAATRATWGELPAEQRPRTIALVAWRPFVKGALRGFATVELPIGLKLVDCAVLVSNGKVWASLPSKPILDRDSRHKIDATGKLAYCPILEWRTCDLADRFSAAVVEMVRREHPSALDEAGR